MKDLMTFLEIVEEAVKLGGEDTGWLARTDDEGYFVHIHKGTKLSANGGLIGFEISAQARNAELQFAAEEAAQIFYGLLNKH